MRISKNIIVVFLTSMLSIGLSQTLNCLAQNNNKSPDKNEVMPTCYKPAVAPVTPEVLKKDLQNRLDVLEKQYKEKKIDTKAYKQSKDNLLQQIKSLK